MFSVMKEPLVEMLKRVSFAVHPSANQPFMNGVLFEQTGERCSVAATDGHRIAALEFDEVNARHLLRSDDSEEIRFHAPWPMVKAALSTLGVVVYVQHDKIVTGDYSITKHTKEAPFPPYRQVIPGASKNLIILDRKAFLRTLYATKKTAVDGFSVSLRFAKEAHHMTIQMPEEGDLQDLGVSAFDFKGDINSPVLLKMQTKYLIEAIKHSKAECISIHFSGSLDPIVFRSAEFFQVGGSECWAERTCVVMPRR